MGVNSLALLDQAARNAPGSLVDAAARALRSGEEPARAAFLARALNALARLTSQLDEQALGDAAGAPSDYEAVLRALEEPEALQALKAADPLAPARLRGLERRAWLLESEGGALTAETVASLLGISRQAVDKRRRTGHLIGVTLGRRGYGYPAWQFGPTGTLQGIEAVLDALRGHDPWMQLAFFLGPNLRLDGETPLEALRQGNVEGVLRAALAYGEQGAA